MTQNESAQTCACGGNCGCQGEEHTHHAYLTREEYIARLEQYLADLQVEIESVQKELIELKSPETIPG